MAIIIPTDKELQLAEDWWHELPSQIKGNQSIWVILAMYAEHVLKTRTVRFDSEKVVAEVGRRRGRSQKSNLSVLDMKHGQE